MESRLHVALSCGVCKEFGVTANGCGISIWGNENVLKWMVVMDVQLSAYTKNYRIIFSVGEF